MRRLYQPNNRRSTVTLVRRVVMTAVALAALLAAQSATAKNTYRIAVMSFGESGEYMKAWTTEIQNHPAVKSGLAKITVFDGSTTRSSSRTRWTRSCCRSSTR